MIKKLKPKKEYIVYIKQHYEPVKIKAEDADDAEYQVRYHYHFGEPIDLEITVEEETNGLS